MSSSTLELTPTPAQSSDVSTAPDAVLAEAQRISEEEIFAAHEGGKLTVVDIRRYAPELVNPPEGK